jgi:hypothetical protein
LQGLGEGFEGLGKGLRNVVKTAVFSDDDELKAFADEGDVENPVAVLHEAVGEAGDGFLVPIGVETGLESEPFGAESVGAAVVAIGVGLHPMQGKEDFGRLFIEFRV